MEIHIALVFVALTDGLGYARASLRGLARVPLSHPLDGPTGAFYVEKPVTVVTLILCGCLNQFVFCFVYI